MTGVRLDPPPHLVDLAAGLPPPGRGAGRAFFSQFFWFCGWVGPWQKTPATGVIKLACAPDSGTWWPHALLPTPTPPRGAHADPEPRPSLRAADARAAELWGADDGGAISDTSAAESPHRSDAGRAVFPPPWPTPRPRPLAQPQPLPAPQPRTPENKVHRGWPLFRHWKAMPLGHRLAAQRCATCLYPSYNWW